MAMVVPPAIPGPPTKNPTAIPATLDTEVTDVLPLVTMPEKDTVPGSSGSTSMGSDVGKVSVEVAPTPTVAVAFSDKTTLPNRLSVTFSMLGMVRVSVGLTLVMVVTVMVWSDEAVRTCADVTARGAPTIWGPAAALGNADIVSVPAATVEGFPGNPVIIVPDGMLGPTIGCPRASPVKLDTAEMVSSLTVTVPVKDAMVDTTVEPVQGADIVMVKLPALTPEMVDPAGMKP